MTELTNVNDRLMSTKELANVLNVSEKTVRENAKKIGMQIKNGIPTLYTEEQATKIKNLISKSGRNDLYNVVQVDNVSTHYELIENYKRATEQLMQFLNQRNIELEIENQSLKTKQIEDAPMVEFAKQVTDSKDAIDMGCVAKVLNLGIGRTRLFEILRNKRILQSNNIPYQRYIDAGYFRVVESKFTTPDGTTHINLKTVVYQSGVDFIRNLIIEKTADRVISAMWENA